MARVVWERWAQVRGVLQTERTAGGFRSTTCGAHRWRLRPATWGRGASPVAQGPHNAWSASPVGLRPHSAVAAGDQALAAPPDAT